MFCPNCGSPINEDEKFCPNCGTPAGSTGQGMDAGGMGTVNNGISKPQNQDLDMVMRIVCGVFAVVFLFAALARIRGIFVSLRWLQFGYLLSNLLGFFGAMIMAVSTAAAAWKWSSKLRNLVFGGAVLSVALRLLSIFVSIFVNLINFGSISIGGAAIVRWLGYVAVAAILFGLMYIMGSAPVVGETKDSLMASMTEGFTELSGAAKDLQAKQAAKNTVINYQVPPAEGQGTYQQIPPTEGQAAYQQVMPIGGQTEYQTNGAPGYGTPPMGGMGYGNPTTPPRGTRAKKTNRSIWMYFLLSLVTCGIYGYVFIYNLAEDVNDICEGDGEKTSGLLAFILLGMVTCGIYYIIWWYKLANRLQANSYRYNVPIQENGTTFLVWTLFGSMLCGIGPWIALHFILKNTNKLCAVYNQYNGLV